MTATDIHTAEQLLTMPRDGMRRELLRGELRTMAPAGGEHGDVEMNLIGSLLDFVKERNLGRIYAGDIGYILARDPDTVRSPDVSFVRQERLPHDRRGFMELSPDLAVEVISPSDRHSDVVEKVDEWLAAGTLLVWVIDPKRREVTAYATVGRPTIFTAEDDLTAGDLLPGFHVGVASLFA